MPVIGCAVRFSSTRPRTGSRSATTTSHSADQPGAIGPLATPTTTNGRLDRRSAAMPTGSGRPASRSTRTAPLRSGVRSLRSSARSASALRRSRIARRYPAQGGGSPGGALGGQWRHGAHRARRRALRPARTPGRRRWSISGAPSAAPAWTRWRSWASAPRSWGCGAAAPPAAAGAAAYSRRRRGHVAVSLPRREDLEAVPAWLELDEVPATTPATWSAVARHLAGRDPEPLVERAQLFGLPVARVGEVASGGGEGGGGIVRHALGPAAPAPSPACASSTCPRSGPGRCAATSLPVRAPPS